MEYYLIGLVLTAVIPLLVNLRLFVRSDEFWRQMAHISETYVKRDALTEFKADVDKKLDEIKESQKEIFRILAERSH